jgi:hypothetical protein
MIGGVHYYTGQLFDMETITRVAHEQVKRMIHILRRYCFFDCDNLIILGGLLRGLGFSSCCRQCSTEITRLEC